MPASRGSEEGCRPGLRASPPRLLKLRSQGSGPWFVFVHHQIRKVRGFCARQGVEVLHWAPGPHRPVPQALLQGDSRGQTPGLCLGVRAVYAGLCLRGGSSWLPLLPGPTHPRAGDSGDPELRALHSPKATLSAWPLIYNYLEQVPICTPPSRFSKAKDSIPGSFHIPACGLST